MLPAVGYTDADQSHFTSRHFWEVGALDPHLRTGWLGRVLDRVGSPDNPLQGVSLDGQLSPTLATARNPVAAINKPEDVRLLDAGRVGAGRGARGARVHRASAARCAARAIPRSRRPRSAAAFAGGVRDALAPLGTDGKPAYTPAAAYPQSAPRRSRSGSPASPRCSPPGCRSAPPRSARRAPTTRTPTRPTRCRRTCKLTFDSLLAFQRDLEARGLADRVLMLVWSEFGRRAAENGSGTDHGAAGCRLPDRHPRGGPDGRRVPRAVDSSTSDGNLRATSDYRGVYGALCGDWFGVDPAAILPDARGIGKPVILK